MIRAVRIAVFAAVIFGCLSFAGMMIRPVPLPWYYPLEHRWALEARPTGLAIDWYGRTLASSVLSLLGGAIAYAGARRSGPLSLRAVRGWTGGVLLAILIAVLVIVSDAVSRRPMPEPWPSSDAR